MKDRGRTQRDLALFLLILCVGFICLLVTAQAAIWPRPVWRVSAGMLSELDPNRDYLTRRAEMEVVEPVRPEVQTPPAWDVESIITPSGSVIVAPPLVWDTPCLLYTSPSPRDS